MRWLAERSLRAAATLPGGRGHTLLLAAMASFYLCTPEASAPEALGVTRAVLDTLDGPADDGDGRVPGAVGSAAPGAGSPRRQGAGGGAGDPRPG